MRPQVGVPIAPDATAAAALRSGVWKRKFSWTARKTPAFSAVFGHRHRIVPGRRERLLDDGGDAAADRLLDQHPVGVHPGDDVDEVDLLLVEHLVDIAVPVRHAELVRRRPRLGRVDVADRDDLGRPRPRGPSTRRDDCARRSRSRRAPRVPVQPFPIPPWKPALAELYARSRATRQRRARSFGLDVAASASSQYKSSAARSLAYVQSRIV